MRPWLFAEQNLEAPTVITVNIVIDTYHICFDQFSLSFPLFRSLCAQCKNLHKSLHKGVHIALELIEIHLGLLSNLNNTTQKDDNCSVQPGN
jgi:hypothetical protein